MKELIGDVIGVVGTDVTDGSVLADTDAAEDSMVADAAGVDITEGSTVADVADADMAEGPMLDIDKLLEAIR